MRTIEMEFKGYIREINKASLEDKAGIYCVYAGTWNSATKTVNPQRLLYVGKAVSIKNRIGGDDHEHLGDWKKELERGQILMYTRAFVSDGDDRTRAEAALIYDCQPPVNGDGKDGFHHKDTKLVLSGRHALIDDEIVVYETD